MMAFYSSSLDGGGGEGEPPRFLTLSPAPSSSRERGPLDRLRKIGVPELVSVIGPDASSPLPQRGRVREGEL